MSESRQGWWDFCETNSKLVEVLPSYEQWSKGEYAVRVPVVEVDTIEYIYVSKKVEYKFKGEMKTCALITPVDKSTLSTFEIQIAESENALRKSIEDLYQLYKRNARTLFYKPATLWYRQAKSDKGELYWDFNHLEDGHCEDEGPTPKHPSHIQAWKGGKWSKSHVHLSETNVVIH